MICMQLLLHECSYISSKQSVWLPSPELDPFLDNNSLKRQSQSQSHIATDSQSVSKSWYRAPSGANDQIFISVWQLRSCSVGRPLWREDGFVFLCAACPCQRSLSRVLVPWDLRPYFTVSRFETSLFVASYDSQGHGGGIRPRLHTGSLSNVKSKSHCDWRSVSL
jgi:hypothetical protein